MEARPFGKNLIKICFQGNAVGYVVRGKNGPKHKPLFIHQHADCILSTGAIVGFFGNDRGGSGSGACVNSAGANLITGVRGYDTIRNGMSDYVDSQVAKRNNLFSTLLVIECVHLAEVKSRFDSYLWELSKDKNVSLKPFHYVGRNCSTFACESFVNCGLVKKPMPGLFDTPNKLFHYLANELKIRCRLSCYSGYLGFEPLEKRRYSRANDKNAKYDIVIRNYKKYFL